MGALRPPVTPPTAGVPGAALQARTENPPAPTVWARVTSRVALTHSSKEMFANTAGECASEEESFVWPEMKL